MAEPFIKWVGGKRQLLPAIDEAIRGIDIQNYHEPFLGGGALFFHLATGKRIKGTARISDINSKLIKTYRAVRDDAEGLIDELSHMQKQYNNSEPEAVYYDWRNKFNALNSESTDLETAALFIALNKTGFNGLYRTNKKGGFNTPWGKTHVANFAGKAPQLNLLSCSRTLQGVDIFCASYKTSPQDSSDFVYMDPPYIPLTATSNFTAYDADGFGDEAQVELSKYLAELQALSVRAIVSNSSAQRTHELYKNFNIVEVSASRRINCVGDSRGNVKELLIKNF